MITFTTFGRHGRLGNQLFQYATLIGFSKKYNCDLALPPWQYANSFKQAPVVFNSSLHYQLLTERNFHYTPDHWDRFANAFRTQNIDIKGWLQSEKYWEHCVADVKQALEFKDDFVSQIKNKFVNVFTKPTIAISVRRGDYVNNQNYDLLPINYYVLALYEHFPNIDDYNILVFSDDLPYCKLHFAGLDNVYFPQDPGAIEQLCLMSCCDHFIIANSTFSWWGAYLGEKPHSKIIRPNYLFAGNLLKTSDFKDHYPDRWTIFDHKDEEGGIKKFDLKDVTFTVPTFNDHPDRRENLLMSVFHLQKSFDTNIIIGEQKNDNFRNVCSGVDYMCFNDMERFHRTKMLNVMAHRATTPIVVNWDADVFVPMVQIIESARTIRDKGIDMVYPYDGRFARVPRTMKNSFQNEFDLGVFRNEVFKGTRENEVKSVGGAIFWDKYSFIDGGMENEYMISYAPEDIERFERYGRLGYSIKKIKGQLFHLDHYIGTNSSMKHDLFEKNWDELHKIRAMSDQQLCDYVETWPWISAIYNETYYDSISEDATASRDSIFSILYNKYINLYSVNGRVIDLGCGVGEWGVNMKEKFGLDYYGVDYKIPKNSLLVPPSNYAEYNLTRINKTPFPFEGKFDLAICMEVLEHIPEKHGQAAVDLLCNLSDIVLFSAATPMQGGRYHLNEQWQTYWEKQFNNNGFYATKLEIRDLIFDDPQVEVWYKQNAVIYVNKNKYPEVETKQIRDFVHPDMFSNVVGTLTDWKKIKPYNRF